MEWGINFTAWPEMLTWPYLILQGWLPYRDIAIAHNPLLLLDLVVFFKIFGVGILQLKIYTWFLIFINSLLTYYVAHKFWSKKAGLISCFIYLVLCIIFEGNGLWFDLALTPFALLLYLFVKEKKYFYSGMVFALGFLTKQTFVWFGLVVVLELLKSTRSRVNNLKNFIFGNLIIVLPFLLTLYLLGILPNFIDWAVKFGIFYLPKADGQVLLPTLKQFVFSFTPIAVSFFNPTLLLWMLVGLAGVYPRFELFHFQPALPFVAIAFSNFIFSYKNNFVKYTFLLLASCYMLLGLSRQLGGKTRFYEPQVVEVVQEIIKTNPQQIYIVNYWDNIYALTKTIPATKPLIPYIPWYLDYNNNKELILNDLKTKIPEIIVLGRRDEVFPDVFEFIEKYYFCNTVNGSVELCYKNK